MDILNGVFVGGSLLCGNGDKSGDHCAVYGVSLVEKNAEYLLYSFIFCSNRGRTPVIFFGVFHLLTVLWLDVRMWLVLGAVRLLRLASFITVFLPEFRIWEIHTFPA